MKIKKKDGQLIVPDQVEIPFIEGDGTGPDIWRASRLVFDKAIDKAYGSGRGICLARGAGRRKGVQPDRRMASKGNPRRYSRACGGD